MAHTPGPWKLAYVAGGKAVVAAEDEISVAACTQRDLRENILNARLIAAAPELLKALIYMHDHHVRDYTPASTHTAGANPNGCYACAAIAKAKGE